jgi:hypothetical protein
LTNLVAEGHAPKITTKLGVHLAYDVEEDTVIVFGDGAIGNELRDDWTVTIDLILQERIEILVVTVIGHYN